MMIDFSKYNYNFFLIKRKILQDSNLNMLPFKILILKQFVQILNSTSEDKLPDDLLDFL